MRERQIYRHSSHCTKMTNVKYGYQKKKLEVQLRNLRNQYNYDSAPELVLESDD